VLEHMMFTELFDKLYFPPIDYPSQVLECGYGCGSWAVTMAQVFAESEVCLLLFSPVCSGADFIQQVTAIDVFPADLPDEPDNLEREIWNLNDPLTPTYRSHHYDLVHSRCVGPGIKKDRWRGYIRDLARLCSRGGWVQCAEWYYNIQSDSGRLNEQHYIYKWGEAYRSAMESDRDPRVGRTLASRLREAGLTNVDERSFRVPIGDWPTGEFDMLTSST
jgi:Methyltransferase domain